MPQNEEYREIPDFVSRGFSTDPCYNDVIQEENSFISLGKEKLNANPWQIFEKEVKIDEIKTPLHFNLDDDFNKILMDIF